MVSAQDGGGEGDVPDAYQTLLTKFDQQERLRVIVQLNVPTQTNKTTELNTPAIHNVQSDLLSTLSSNNVKLIHQYDYIPFMAVEVDRAGLEGLLKSPLVVGVFEDHINFPLLNVSIPFINADDAWIDNYAGSDQVVAVLDTGVDKNHGALVGKVVAEACYSGNYSGYSLCKDGVNQSTAPGSALPYIGSCPPGYCDHGTHVAGIVAANNSTVKGVAKDANIIAMQVFTLINGSKIGAYDTDIIKGLERVLFLSSEYTIAAVNLSLGGEYFDKTCDTYNPAMKLAVDNLRNSGIVTIAASGNDGFTSGISYPACISSIVSVGATSKTVNQVAYYSNSASILDLLAPGGDLYNGGVIYSTIPFDQYVGMQGTSMAAPHVAGAWALIRSAEPEASVDEILNALKETGVLILDTRNPSYPTIKPRIDVYNALQSILQPRPTIPGDIQASDGAYVDKVRIFWSSSENTTFYQIFRSYRDDPIGAIQVGSVDHTSIIYDDTSADPGVKFYYWVKACNEIYCSDFSNPNDGWRGTGTSTPSAPTGVTASDGEFENKVRIAWYEVGGADYYQVFRNEINDPNSAITILDSLPEWSYYDNDLALDRDKEYYYWVKACKTPAACSGYSVYDTGSLKDDFQIFLPLLNKNYADVDPIKNGNFEKGSDGSWTEYSYLGYDLILSQTSLLVPPHSGTWAVWLGGDIYETSTLSQSVLISSTRPYLHFWYWIGSADTYCGDDVFRLKINNSEVIKQDLCTSTSTSGWVERVVNLSSHAGSTVTLMFEVTTDFALNSNFFLDDVSMSNVSTASAAVAEEMQVLGDVTSRKGK